MSKRGRPPVLDSAKRGHIVSVIALGGSVATAARTVGCSARTIYSTARRDEEFRNDIQRARAQRELTLLKLIQTAAEQPQYWRAAAWLLERVFPDRYARKPARAIRITDHQASLDFVLNVVHAEVQEHDGLYSRIAARLNTHLARDAGDLDGVADTAIELFIRNDEDPASGQQDLQEPSGASCVQPKSSRAIDPKTA